MEVVAVLLVIFSAVYGMMHIGADLFDLIVDHRIPQRWWHW